jgi:hypothetical protein
MEDTNTLLKLYFKKYTDGKQKIKKNKDGAFESFKDSLEILKILRDKHSVEIVEHKVLLDESESECYKYINLTIETSIENANIDTGYKINFETLLSSLEYGNLELIKKAKYGDINFKEIIKDQTILHLAITHGDTSFLKFAFKLGARIDTINKNGNTLMEYACLAEDPNMINFLGSFGANMQKHLYFRDGTIKYLNYNDSIDISILLKIILSYIPLNNNEKNNIDNNINNKIFNKVKFIKNSINLKDKININNYTFNDLFIGLLYLLNKLPEDSALSYLNIIAEELSFVLHNKLGCPSNKLEIILINIIPFIEYPFNISIDWVISSELKYLIKSLLKKKNNSLDIKKELFNNIWEIYIEKEIIQEDYLGCIISQWITKIKV